MSLHSKYSNQRSRSDFQASTGIATGFNNGFIVTRRSYKSKGSRVGKLGKRTALVRGVVRSIWFCTL